MWKKDMATYAALGIA